ncbi:MAG: hypothetical protein ACO295_00480 [Sediminibacterium sp.]
MHTLEAKRDKDFEEKKFFAALKGVKLDSGGDDHDAWERLKAKVASRGQTTDPNDITSLRGSSAQRAGFGIGHGLDYQVIE